MELFEELCEYTAEVFKLDSQELDLTADDIRGRSRKKEIQIARLAISFVLYKIYSGNAIGNFLGKRDHATIMAASRTAKDIIQTDKSFALKVQQIQDKFDELRGLEKEQNEEQAKVPYQERKARNADYIVNININVIIKMSDI